MMISTAKAAKEYKGFLYNLGDLIKVHSREDMYQHALVVDRIAEVPSGALRRYYAMGNAAKHLHSFDPRELTVWYEIQYIHIADADNTDNKLTTREWVYEDEIECLAKPQDKEGTE